MDNVWKMSKDEHKVMHWESLGLISENSLPDLDSVSPCTISFFATYLERGEKLYDKLRSKHVDP